jgi:nucleotide-binding universal stress UspA family protein
MLEIRNVLTPVDFTPASQREMALAVEICQLFGARLVLHHNRNGAPPGFSRAWDWGVEHHLEERPPAERALRELLASLPAGLVAEARISDGQVVPALMHLARRLPADLMVLASHGCSTEDHASVAERVIAEAPCPVLTLRDCEGEQRPLFQGRESTAVLVPTDFSSAARQALELAFELARKLSLRLHLLHVVPAGGRLADPALAGEDEATGSSATELAARRRLGGLVPADLEQQVELHVAKGEPGAGILLAAIAIGAELIVMGEHSRALLQRWLTADTARELLHRAPCPVLYVPEQAAGRH